MKKESIKSFIDLSVNRPNKLRSFRNAASYAIKYGLDGLRMRIRHEIWLDRAEEPQPLDEPGAYSGGIKFSILVPTYNVDVCWLEKAVESVRNQTYKNWELCIVDDASSSAELKEYICSLNSDQIKTRLLSNNSGISGATNEAARLATGDYIVLLDNDDELKLNALFELFLKASSGHADVIYTDNDIIDEHNNRIAVLHKPDWSPDLLLSQMYVGHLLAFKKAKFDEVGGFRSDYDGSQDYDLLLRLCATTNSIDHISKVLYSWRSLPSSTATNPNAKPYSQFAGMKAIQSYLDNRYGQGFARVFETDNLFVYDVRYKIPENTKASIIIPTKDHVDDLKQAIESIIDRTSYQNFEILVVNNNSAEEETLCYLKELPSLDRRISVIDAPIQFNWSKLNNLAVERAKGNVFVFLNNDTQVISPDWLERLVENACRPDVGVVGGLLLYPDKTIQHAGVVIGMGGWADHVYKGEQPVHNGNPFISPMVTRDVSAVTGACMAISKDHYEMLRGFNEDFIVCGSDIELCLHARKFNLYNIYNPSIQLMHYESKTRDAKDIPAVDFKLSDSMYSSYRRSGDPFYNCNLDYGQTTPSLLSQREKLMSKISSDLPVTLKEIRELRLNECEMNHVRLNLFLPSVNPEDVYGGISTALKFFNELSSELNCDVRIIVLDAEPRLLDLDSQFASFDVHNLGTDSCSHKQIVSAFNRETGALSWGKGDWGVCTCWWSAFCMQDSLGKFQNSDIKVNPLIYLIQDFEPGFYAWSSQYLLADSTYRSPLPTMAVFNSVELRDYFVAGGYHFDREFVFDPALNEVLAKELSNLGGLTAKRKQILVYGRPNTDRNAFSLVVETLRRWIESDEQSSQWELLSAGEDHAAVYLAKGRYLTSVGKLTLGQYAQVLKESSVGISLMVSPHPSYPPLEMAAFGVRVITNNYANKNLSASFSENITSLPSYSLSEAVSSLHNACSAYESEVRCGEVPKSYLKQDSPFPFISDLADIIRGVTF